MSIHDREPFRTELKYESPSANRRRSTPRSTADARYAHAVTVPAQHPPTEREVVAFFLNAYRHGAFPMAEPERPRSGIRRRGPARPRRIDWYVPDPRAIIELHAPPRAPQDLGGFHIPRSLARLLRRNPFVITSDRAFEAVIRACAEPMPEFDREDSWLDDRLIEAYIALHRAGHAHSVEVWRPDPAAGPNAPGVMVGGVYGVSIGAAFCAESMFCRPALGGSGASKVALAYLIRHLRDLGYDLVDVQLRNHHTDQFGVVEIPASSYLERLGTAANKNMEFGTINPRWTHSE